MWSSSGAVRVAGLVLVDPVLACSWQHRTPGQARTKRRAERFAWWGAWLARFGLLRLATSRVVVKSLIATLTGGVNEKAVSGIVGRLRTELVKLPSATIPVIRSHWCRVQNYVSMSAHLAALDDTLRALRNLPLNCPVTVISAADTPPDGMVEHQAIAALSARGRHIVARGSGHWIQFDEPDLVIDAIRQVVRSRS